MVEQDCRGKVLAFYDSFNYFNHFWIVKIISWSSLRYVRQLPEVKYAMLLKVMQSGALQSEAKMVSSLALELATLATQA